MAAFYFLHFLSLFGRISSFSVAILVITWALHFQASFIPLSPSQEDLIYAWLFGFTSFWHKGEIRTTRLKVLPWHVFLGLYTYGLAVVTAETGLLEKLTLLQANQDVTKRGSESSIVKGLGLGLVILSSVMILAAVFPKHQTA